MNNTKKCLSFSAGIALAIALCSSIQMVAMTSSNPTDQKAYITKEIAYLNKEIDAFSKIAMQAENYDDQSTVDSANKQIDILTKRRYAFALLLKDIASGKKTYTQDAFVSRIYDIKLKIK
jgi:hypothetical protein